MVVTFCGHNETPSETVKERLRQVVEDLIGEGATLFLLGGYGGFDRLAAEVVWSLKKAHPEIHSTRVIPYLDREYSTDIYDDTTFPPLESVPRKFAISKRNEWMVDQADVLVAYVTHDWGGAATTLQYAKRKKKRIVSVAE
ncbi:MAG: DUF1273 family protein [Clostridia bacterium]|nr:DUF1273 family protein [Clostridia bacterium]